MAKDVITWQCMGCEGKPQFTDSDQFREHAVQVHGVPRPIQGMRAMALHLDGPKRYATVYNWTFDLPSGEELQAIQKIESERTGEDAAFWADMGNLDETSTQPKS